MTQIGYALSSEEHAPSDLVQWAVRAEEAGFSFALISDHYHPWIDRQGHSAFVWSVLGAIAERTSRIHVGTGVTCPMIRIHPAIIAQAAATTAAMMPGRFFLGLGTGENLNEHVVGAGWPSAAVRREMLAEAILVIRMLLGGGEHSHDGRFFTVSNARIYSLPPEPPKIMVAASGPETAELAGRIADGIIGTAPKRELLEAFEAGGGGVRPRYGQIMTCWAADEAEARRTALEWWPTAAVPGELGQELPLPRHFEQAAELVTEDDIAELIICGPDPERHLDAIREYADAGYDHVYVHQVGPDQQGFFRFYEREVLPKIG